MTEKWREIARKWLARLAFSFILIALVLIWEGYRMIKTEPSLPRVIAYFVGAGACLALGSAGMRERHRGQS